MALIACEECGRAISDRAPHCIGCGACRCAHVPVLSARVLNGGGTIDGLFERACG